jgi:hypothetical protein
MIGSLISPAAARLPSLFRGQEEEEERAHDLGHGPGPVRPCEAQDREVGEGLRVEDDLVALLGPHPAARCEERGHAAPEEYEAGARAPAHEGGEVRRELTVGRVGGEQPPNPVHDNLATTAIISRTTTISFHLCMRACQLKKNRSVVN